MKILDIVFLFVLFFSFSCKNDSSKSDYQFQGIPFNEVKISDQFWSPKIETTRTVTIPASFAKCEETGRVANFEKAAKKEGKFGTEFPFDDTDIYKIIEGASYSMSVHPDSRLDRYVDSLITIVGKAQETDGYLYTARTIDPQHPHEWSGNERWINESIDSHELYNSGHLLEAASAHFQSTGKRNFLDIALKNADLLRQVFAPGKRDNAPGHEIVEMGLVKLYRLTKEQKYLDLAKYFIDSRGKGYDPKKSYSQDHKPFIQQDEAVGHAVRAGYLYSGVADVAALTGNTAYISAIDKIWENMVTKKFYITGGIGSRHEGEAFGDNYELPNLTAYNETCAAIANVYWNYRMFLLHGDSKYIDVLERSLYNGVISGIGLDGKTFFYPNPLECDLHYKFNSGEKLDRQPWFGCSCCPTNMCRFLPSVPGYIYAKGENKLFVNLFVTSSAKVPINSTNNVAISQETQYPWDGQVRISVSPEKPNKFSLYLRIPGWAKNQPVPGDLYTYSNPATDSVSVKINGVTVSLRSEKGYFVIDREWKPGDVVDYNLPMMIHLVEANKNVSDDRGKMALERGPVVYCLESTDNPKIDSLSLTSQTHMTATFDPKMLEGVEKISGQGTTSNENFIAIPYYVWNNRGIGKMKVWIPVK